MEPKASETGNLKDYLFARVDNTLVRIDFADILFVEAMGDYVEAIEPSTGRTLVTKSWPVG